MQQHLANLLLGNPRHLVLLFGIGEEFQDFDEMAAQVPSLAKKLHCTLKTVAANIKVRCARFEQGIEYRACVLALGQAAQAEKQRVVSSLLLKRECCLRGLTPWVGSWTSYADAMLPKDQFIATGYADVLEGPDHRGPRAEAQEVKRRARVWPWQNELGEFIGRLDA